MYNGLVYFTELSSDKVGCLDPSTGTFTEWNMVERIGWHRPTGIAVYNGYVFYVQLNIIGRIDAAASRGLQHLSKGEVKPIVTKSEQRNPATGEITNGYVFHDSERIYFRLDLADGPDLDNVSYIVLISAQETSVDAIALTNHSVYIKHSDGIYKLKDVAFAYDMDLHLVELAVRLSDISLAYPLKSHQIQLFFLTEDSNGRDIDETGWMTYPPDVLRVEVESPYAINLVEGVGEYYRGSVVKVSIGQTILDCGNGTRRVFAGWITNVTWQALNTTSPELIFSLESNVKIFAIWKTQYHLTININPQGSGMIKAFEWYDSGSTATIEATPNFGYEFESWSGNITERSPTISLKMDAPQTINANFKSTFPLFLIGFVIIAICSLLFFVYRSKKSTHGQHTPSEQ